MLRFLLPKRDPRHLPSPLSSRQKRTGRETDGPELVGQLTHAKEKREKERESEREIQREAQQKETERERERQANMTIDIP